MANIAYYRVSTNDQSIEFQRAALSGGHTFDKEFSDEGVSGKVLAVDRPGFSKLLDLVRKGDTVYVYAVDRLGRDAIDVQRTVRALVEKGVTVDIRGLGSVGRGVGELIVSVMAQMANMERQKIIERTGDGRARAKESLAKTGKTHRGKDGMGRPVKGDKAAVLAWRAETGASIRVTAEHFKLSEATVKRYTAKAKNALSAVIASNRPGAIG
jgi:putative DNA-invertase from lambdoid prophage Rac